LFQISRSIQIAKGNIGVRSIEVRLSLTEIAAQGEILIQQPQSNLGTVRGKCSCLIAQVPRFVPRPRELTEESCLDLLVPGGVFPPTVSPRGSISFVGCLDVAL
jgi:hypothetical protein